MGASFNPLDLSNRHVLVTGAASGIGRSVTCLLDKLGARCALVDLDEAGLRETLVSCGGKDHRAHVCDLRRLEDIDALVQGAAAQGGPFHGIVHAAGIQAITPSKVLTPSNWRDLFAVNTEAALCLAKTLHSRKVYAGSQGSIVFVSSVIGIVGSPGAVAYSMSKAALLGLTKSLALEFASKAVRVNSIAPGFVKTPLFERVEKDWDEAQRKAVEALHPLGFGEPEDVANAVAFLLADTSRWITGTTLVVDGGYLAQ